MKVTFQWIEPCRSERLRVAQQKLLESIAAFGLEPNLYQAGPKMEKFLDILRFARANSDGEGFVWCNSDVILTRNPFEIPQKDLVTGFHRREIPSGEICYGVDMFYIPNTIWDNYLNVDAPDLWCGATMIDCWLTRASQKIAKYAVYEGYIDHPSHERSKASGGGDRYFRDNVKIYNRWAKAHDVWPVENCVPIPFLGEWNNSVRDYFARLRKVDGWEKFWSSRF